MSDCALASFTKFTVTNQLQRMGGEVISRSCCYSWFGGLSSYVNIEVQS